MNKVCGFYVSSVHLVTMILPYLRERLNNKIKFETFFEYNLTENLNNILDKLIINEDDKQKIININWKNTRIKKYSFIEKGLKNLFDNNKENILLISGSQKYIKETNYILDKFFNKNSNKMILHLVTFGLFTVLQWCYTVLLLKHILKIGLAGEAEKVTDFNQAFVAVGQKAFSLF